MGGRAYKTQIHCRPPTHTHTHTHAVGLQLSKTKASSSDKRIAYQASQ
jgi:hypothetical protein